MGHQYFGRLPEAWVFVRLKSALPTDEQLAALDKFVQGIEYYPQPKSPATSGPASDVATTGVAPLPPPKFGAGDVKALLAIVEGADHSSDKTDALKKLAQITPADAQQRETVAGALEQIIVTDTAFIADEAAETLAVWHRPQTVDVLLPLLAETEWVSWKRTRAMKVLGKTRDKRAATPIMRWLLKDTDNVVAAMIDLGPIAEDEAIGRLREKEPTARAAAARILSAVGTQKCLIELRRAANDPRDAGAAAAARSALETVLSPVKQAKPATTTTATGPTPAR